MMVMMVIAVEPPNDIELLIYRWRGCWEYGVSVFLLQHHTA